MILSHYSPNPLTAVWSRQQNDAASEKPQGLWVSVGGEDDWPSYCRAENFCVERLAVRTQVVLCPDARILWLSNGSDIENFTREFGLIDRHAMYSYSRDHVNVVEWARIAATYQGIVIAPYVWSHRLEGRTRWYYGWDCASGCIWDAGAIAALLISAPADVECVG